MYCVVFEVIQILTVFDLFLCSRHSLTASAKFTALILQFKATQDHLKLCKLQIVRWTVIPAGWLVMTTITDQFPVTRAPWGRHR